VAIAGCGSSVETTLQKEWQVEAGSKARTITVEPQREHLLVGKEESTTIYSADGSVLYGTEEGRSIIDFISGTGANTIASMEANELGYVLLSEPGLALVFDYTADDDIVRAVDLETGTEEWEQRDYVWSLENTRA